MSTKPSTETAAPASVTIGVKTENPVEIPLPQRIERPERRLLLIDGHRANDNIYHQAGLGTESVIDVDLIDRIEVIRGPSSSLYGTNAFFGVINVITKRGRDVRGVEHARALGLCFREGLIDLVVRQRNLCGGFRGAADPRGLEKCP